MSETAFSVPPNLRRGQKRHDQAEHLASADAIWRLMSAGIGREDLAGQTVLDMGCGTKMVQLILDNGLDVGHYIGIDIGQAMIEYLQKEVTDPRFSFHHLNLHNAMYNPGGEPLEPAMGLPVEESIADVICLFSVFTHLAPHDYVNMLKLLRPYIKPDGYLVYSLFVNETTAGGHGYIDRMARALDHNPGQLTQQMVDEFRNRGVPDFVDDDPSRPLLRAIYSRTHALELIEGTGWTVESLNDPQPGIQHYMICRPDPA